MKALPFLLLCLAFVNSCYMTKEAGERMQANLEGLQTEFDVVKKAHAAEKAQLQQRLKEADDRIAELRHLIDDFQQSTGRSSADIGVDIEKIKSQIMDLRGQIEIMQHTLDTTATKQVSAASGSSSSQPADSKPKVEIVKSTSDTDPLAGIKRPDKQDEFYRLAAGMLEAKQSQAARMLFDEFIKKWPNSPYAGNALYWIGESYYIEKNYRDAAISFQQVREKYPKGSKAADALLRLGYCFVAMDMYREALPFLKDFVQTYPKNPNVAKVKEKIDEVEKKIKKSK
jgi:tol-pal system protein YbgF